MTATGGPRLPALRPREASACALLAYLLLAFWMLSRTWLGDDLTHRLVGGGGDPLGFIWFIAWLPHSLAHGHLPFFTRALMAPQGANLLNSTSIPLPSLLLWPVTALFGPVPSYDLLATLAIALSAWAAHLALLRVTENRWAAWVGGLIYGFSGYMDGQATAHVNLLIVVFPPLVAIIIDELLRGRRPLLGGAALGLCASAQAYIDEEILATTAILAALALLLAWLHTRPQREILRGHLLAGATAAVLFTLLAGPAIIYQLAGPQHVGGVFVTSGRYVNDLAGFIVPSSIQLFSTAGSRHLVGGFSGGDGEYGAYLGLPLILLLGWATWRLRRRALPACLLLAVSAVLSLGPHLRVLGGDTGIWLPWILPSHLPLLKNAVPDRFNLYLWLAVAALLALLIDDLKARPPFGRRALGWALCTIALLPIIPHLAPSERVTVPPVIGSPGRLSRTDPAAHTILIAPYNDGQLAMYAQAESGFSYRVPEGGLFVPGHGGPSYGMREGPLLYALAALAGRRSTRAGRTPTDRLCLGLLARNAPLESRCTTHYRNALRALGVNAVVLLEEAPPLSLHRNMTFFNTLLGPPLKGRDALVFTVKG